MPKYAHHTFEDGGIAIWHITESSDELYALLATHQYDAQLLAKRNECRRAEWLAVRLLVKELFGNECKVAYHPTGRPYLEGGDAYISISHTKGYAAVAYHRSLPLGVDIEYISSRVERIAHRFTSQMESSYIDVNGEHNRQLYHLVNWSAKETLYKLYDSPAMAEFQEVFHIAPYMLSTQGTLNASVNNENKDDVLVHYRLFPDFVCTWAWRHLFANLYVIS
jgi:4'-phosphopantetheinyl transferase EntD